MSRDKQIEEIQNEIIRWGENADKTGNYNYPLSAHLYTAGYRKAEDVAREIIDDLESRILPSGKGLYAFPVITHEFIAELKKKYTEEK